MLFSKGQKILIFDITMAALAAILHFSENFYRGWGHLFGNILWKFQEIWSRVKPRVQFLTAAWPKIAHLLKSIKYKVITKMIRKMILRVFEGIFGKLIVSGLLQSILNVKRLSVHYSGTDAVGISKIAP